MEFLAVPKCVNLVNPENAAQLVFFAYVGVDTAENGPSKVCPPIPPISECERHMPEPFL